MRYYHYTYRTEQVYCGWIRRLLKFTASKSTRVNLALTENRADNTDRGKSV
ncbi:hypothetical protein GT409_05915 [Tichowtungia aerotolerans]|uniref:Integrase SAM-like N-terminal domain-containing protein n=1 Tax=Tichowtungia aerotolerans TaxID=2697043 RepID=A0A6P1M8G0_9BACT|nr:hypothetical protein GT409_05915 [Tichowtungia aerotolerans]